MNKILETVATVHTHTHTHGDFIKERKRQTNFELLRIISMILIILSHIAFWGGIVEKANSFNNKIYGEFISIGGKLGVNLFVLISGYFLINSKFKLKKFFKIIFEIWTYSVGIVSLCYMLKIGSFNNKLLLKSLFPVSYKAYWFATSYVGLYLLFPTINKFLSEIERDVHCKIIIVLGVMLSIIPTIMIKAEPFNSDLMWFIYVYIIGAYLSKYEINFVYSRKINILIILLITLFMFMTSVFCTIVGTKIGILNKGIDYFNKMNSIPMLILSISVFIFFKNIEIKENKKILLLARSSFSVYLIHDNFIFREYLYTKILKIQNFYESNTLILINYTILVTAGIYLVCTLIDIVRIELIEKRIFNTKNGKVLQKFEKFVENFLNID